MDRETRPLYPLTYDLASQWDRCVPATKWNDLNPSEKDAVIGKATQTIRELISEVFSASASHDLRQAQHTISNNAIEFCETIQKTEQIAGTREREKEKWENELHISDEMVEDMWRKHSWLRWSNLSKAQRAAAQTEIAKTIWRFMYSPSEFISIGKTITRLSRQWDTTNHRGEE